MITGTIRIHTSPLLFFISLFLLVGLYAVHLFSFTVFEGFSTLSSDAGSYMLMAKKWSPYFETTPAVLNTWPFHTFPPAFPFILAVTGASSSLHFAHVFVSLCMLGSITVSGIYVHRSIGGINGYLMLLAFCLFPGATTSSMGILSENLYLLGTLTVLLLHAHLKQKMTATAVQQIALFGFLLLILFTRSIGVALVIATLASSILDKELGRTLRLRIFLISIFTLVAWHFWGYINPQSEEGSYASVFEYSVFSTGSSFGEISFGLLEIVKTNLVQIVLSFKEYLFLNHPDPWFFAYSLVLLVICVCGLFFRVYKQKLDAIYLCLYLCILLIWPYPGEMLRFIHPIVFLLIYQAIASIEDLSRDRDSSSDRTVATVVLISAIFCSLFIQSQLYQKRNLLPKESSHFVNSYEFFQLAFSNMGENYAKAYGGVTQLMSMSSEYIEDSSVVASVKHENFTILSDRKSVNLTAVVSFDQQLCNLWISSVDVLFLSDLTTKFNQRGLQLLGAFEKFESNHRVLKSDDGFVDTHLLYIDKEMLSRHVLNSSYACQSFKHFER